MDKIMRNPIVYVLFLFPTLLMLCVFFFFPLVQAIYHGFTEWNGINPPKFTGLDNLVTALQDVKFLKSMVNNLYFILFTCVISIPTFVILAILISRVRVFASLYKIAYFVPVILSTAVIGILWGVVLEPEIGMLNSLLRAIGLDEWASYWLADPGKAMIAILVVNAWQWSGFNIILILTGIYGIPKDISEASSIDGANAFQHAIYMTIPMLRPVLAVVLLLSVIGSMKSLDIVLVMTQGGPFGSTHVMATYMIEQAYNRQNYGYSNMIAFLIFIITLVFSLFTNFVTKKWGEDAT
jgi:raffinose/stachyose/melibiose transport system permease protein